jgi:hypothetical protein
MLFFEKNEMVSNGTTDDFDNSWLRRNILLKGYRCGATKFCYLLKRFLVVVQYNPIIFK